MKVELQTRTSTDILSVYINVGERHTSIESIEKVIVTLRAAQAWLKKEIGRTQKAKK